MTDQGTPALVTGATGGLGVALVEVLLADGYRVTATGRSTAWSDRLRAMGARFVAADLTVEGVAEQLCRDQQVVFHAAALSRAWGPAEAFEAINLAATARLLEAARRSGCGRFVFISSPSVYARLRDQIGLTEADPPAARPLNHYARTKLAAERLVQSANGPGFLTVAVRPRAIVGPDDQVILPALVGLLRRSRVPLLRDGTALVEPTDVRDVAHAVRLVASNAARLGGEVLNISGGQPTTVKEIATRLAAEIGLRVHFTPVALPVARVMAHAADFAARLTGPAAEPMLTRYALATLAYSQTFDLTKARQRIGYCPRHDPMKTMLLAARKRFS